MDTTRPTVSRGRTISRSRALTTVIWLPVAPGRRPLIVFAHGFDVGPSTYRGLMQSWAAHGYVVAAPEFPLTDPAVAGPNLDEYDIDHQPADVRFVTDYLVSPASPVAGRIDRAEVAVGGHSDGAETALAAAMSPAPAGEPAFRALLVFGGQPVPGGAGRNPPVLVGQGDADRINPPSNGYAVFQQAVAPKYLIVFKGAGHLPPLQAGSTWYPATVAVTEAFLDGYVAGDRPPSAVASAAARYTAVASFRAG